MKRSPRRLLRFLPFAVLGGENLIIFFRHYFRGYGFPWDFVGSYYAAAAYWTESVSRGHLAAWMPFQWMGYPFLLNVQSGLYYPPMWIFPLLRIPYTLRAAVVFQCLHIFAGSLGMYALARSLVRSRREALLAAVCFQLFGGFYSNSEHVDIVRAFALTPWLLWSAMPPSRAATRHPRRMLLAPLFVFAMAVGGYPGNFFAALFLVGLLVVLLILQRGWNPPSRRWAATLAASVALGIAMATLALAPGFLHRKEFLRYYETARLGRAALSAAHLPGLVVENDGLPLDPSVSSTWIGFMVVAGVCLLSKQSLRRFWPIAALAACAAAMAAGSSLPVYPLVTRLLPPLAYSRFPASDYRGFAAVLLIVLAAAGWRDLRLRRVSRLGFLLRLVPLAVLSAWAVSRVYGVHPIWPRPALAVVGLLATLTALSLWRSSRRWPAAAAVAMLAAISFEGSRVLPRILIWSVKDLIGLCRTWSPTPARMYDAGVVVDPRVFEAHPGPRPPRIEGDGPFAPGAIPYRASGYLRGDYDLADFGGLVLVSRREIMKNEGFLPYMRREWLPVLISPPPAASGDGIEVADLSSRVAEAAPDPRVAVESLGIDFVRYRVATDEPVLLVENEIYFPGWSSTREGGGETEAAAPAVRVNGAFRGWLLPAGRYAMRAEFHFPRLRALVAATVIAWATWIAWLAMALRARRRV